MIINLLVIFLIINDITFLSVLGINNVISQIDVTNSLYSDWNGKFKAVKNSAGKI